MAIYFLLENPETFVVFESRWLKSGKRNNVGLAKAGAPFKGEMGEVSEHRCEVASSR